MMTRVWAQQQDRVSALRLDSSSSMVEVTEDYTILCNVCRQAPREAPYGPECEILLQQQCSVTLILQSLRKSVQHALL